jgi:hypothetical protein
VSVLGSLATPALAFAGALVGVAVTRRGARELETRSRREETMRNLRWAAEMAIARDDQRAQLGIAELRALGESDLLDEEQRGFVDAALASVLEEPLEEVEGAEADGRLPEASLQDGASAEPSQAGLESSQENEEG